MYRIMLSRSICVGNIKVQANAARHLAQNIYAANVILTEVLDGATSPSLIKVYTRRGFKNGIGYESCDKRFGNRQKCDNSRRIGGMIPTISSRLPSPAAAEGGVPAPSHGLHNATTQPARARHGRTFMKVVDNSQVGANSLEFYIEANII